MGNIITWLTAHVFNKFNLSKPYITGFRHVCWTTIPCDVDDSSRFDQSSLFNLQIVTIEKLMVLAFVDPPNSATYILVNP